MLLTPEMTAGVRTGRSGYGTATQEITGLSPVGGMHLAVCDDPAVHRR